MQIIEAEHYDINEMGKEEWERVTGMKVFGHIECKSLNGDGFSIFSKYRSEQYKVFDNYLKESGFFEGKDMSKMKKALQDITAGIDNYGKFSFAGTTGESIILTERRLRH